MRRINRVRRTCGLLLGLIAVAGAPALTAPSAATADEQEHPVLLAAGDISSCDAKTDERTAEIIRAVPQAKVAALGDLVEGFAPNEFESCFGPSWGSFKDRIFPALGDQEYFGGEVDDYAAYFGARAGEPRRGWYSYDIGSWHVVVLNSACDPQLDHPPDRPLKEVDGGCEADSPRPSGCEPTWPPTPGCAASPTSTSRSSTSPRTAAPAGRCDP